LIPGGLYNSGVPDLLEHLDVRLVLFFGLLLIVEVNSGSVKVKVRGDDPLSPVDEEEGCVTD
jgi:hypothetical protein